MILLYFALSLLSVLRLSECRLVYHLDCDQCMLPTRSDLVNRHMTDHHADQDLLNHKFGKAQARLTALAKEMNVLSNVRTANTGGNMGLQNAASFLFESTFTFRTVYKSASDVATSLMPTKTSDLTNSDTVRLLQDLLYGPTLHWL